MTLSQYAGALGSYKLMALGLSLRYLAKSSLLNITHSTIFLFLHIQLTSVTV